MYVVQGEEQVGEVQMAVLLGACFFSRLSLSSTSGVDTNEEGGEQPRTESTKETRCAGSKTAGIPITATELLQILR